MQQDFEAGVWNQEITLMHLDYQLVRGRQGSIYTSSPSFPVTQAGES